MNISKYLELKEEVFDRAEEVLAIIMAKYPLDKWELAYCESVDSQTVEFYTYWNDIQQPTYFCEFPTELLYNDVALTEFLKDPQL